MSSAARKPVTISLPNDLTDEVRRICKAKRTTPRRFVVDALRRQLALQEIRGLRRRIVRKATARGIVTDEDALRAVS